MLIHVKNSFGLLDLRVNQAVRSGIQSLHLFKYVNVKYCLKYWHFLRKNIDFKKNVATLFSMTSVLRV